MAEQEFIEVMQIIEKDEPDVQPSQGQEEGEEEQAKPDAVTLAGLYLLFRMSPPVAAVQAVEAAGPDGAAAGGLCHGEGRKKCGSSWKVWRGSMTRVQPWWEDGRQGVSWRGGRLLYSLELAVRGLDVRNSFV